MRIAVQTFFDGTQAEPLAEYAAGTARILEERGFGGVWLSEHVVTFDRYDPQYPYPYDDEGTPPALLSEIGFVDPMISLAAFAMASTTLRLGTGIAIIPQRNPVYFAKMGAAIDLLSQGRFIAGVGLGWSAQEFDATNTPFARRGARMDEYLEVIRRLWTEDRARFAGEFYSLPECIHLPKPCHRPHPPFYIGGESPAALRRLAKMGQGWFAFRQTPEELAPKLPALADELAKVGRTPADLTIVASPGADRGCTAVDLAGYARLGVAEVVVVCVANSLAGFTDEADRLAEALVVPAQKL